MWTFIAVALALVFFGLWRAAVVYGRKQHQALRRLVAAHGQLQPIGDYGVGVSAFCTARECLKALAVPEANRPSLMSLAEHIAEKAVWNYLVGKGAVALEKEGTLDPSVRL